METLRWILLIGTEVIFWTGLAAFFALRYGLDRPDLSRWVLTFVVAEHVALLVVGIADFARTGRWETYQTVVAVVLGYMLVCGKKDLASLDRWVERKVTWWRARRSRT